MKQSRFGIGLFSLWLFLAKKEKLNNLEFEEIPWQIGTAHLLQSRKKVQSKST